ncbi:MAG: hypothetical protein ABII01_05080 [Candidatus Woesearchaeota archaeon]
MKIAPLPSTFMLTSIIGFFISVIWVEQYSVTFAFAFGLVFALMFISSLVSMTYADADAVLKLDGKLK